MRVFVFLVAALLATSEVCLMSADAPKGGVDEKELTKFQGKWTVVSVIVEGKPLDDEAVKNNTLVIKGTKITATHKEKDREVVTTSIITKLDASKTPGEIDGMVENGPNKGKIGKGLYKFDGDKLTVARVDPGKDRPTEMASKPGSGVALVTLKHAK